jgi:two-component system response regulator GlrR
MASTHTKARGSTVVPPGASILIVDDFEPQRFMRKRQLEAAGYRVFDVAGSTAARHFLATQVPALVLTDIGLNDGNGIALCAEIKRLHPGLPVVVVSATFRTPDVQRDALAAGADAVLTDPVGPEQLLRIITNLHPPHPQSVGPR